MATVVEIGIQDSYSPVHNENGNPAVYDPAWGVQDAKDHGHSPTDGSGNEGSDDLTNQTRDQMINETRKAYNAIMGSRRSRERPINVNCGIRTRCYPGGGLDVWN